MFSYLTGTIGKEQMGLLTVDVNGAGYAVNVGMHTWDQFDAGATATLWTAHYVREDRFEFFGFADSPTKALFQELVQISGIGPRTALELCDAPRSVLLGAIRDDDPSALQVVKGIGRKTAEKLLLELSSLAEKRPDLFAGGSDNVPSRFDPDAVAALTQLGFSNSEILRVLESLPRSLANTEERVTAALRSL